MWTGTSADGAGSARAKREELAGVIDILERERDQLLPLVTAGPPNLRPTRERQLRSITQRLAVARAKEAAAVH